MGVYAYDADAQVLVTEAHADFRNLLPEALDRRAELLRGTPKPSVKWRDWPTTQTRCCSSATTPSSPKQPRWPRACAA
ncbi:M55 family metallopeptidase [Amycolatopsis taiwanensis]|uniref:M55 family metallopeptidase n=1 Tax=Amycolatopsis taiwanensis TaxID=342230 RepID=UPI003CCB98FB